MNLPPVSIDPLNAAATVSVAIVGALIAWYVGRRARYQAELQVFSLFREQIISLAKASIDLIAQAVALSRSDPQRRLDFFQERLRIETDLSGQIDIARLFLPNVQGLRPAALNRLMAAHYAIEALDYTGPGHNTKGEDIRIWLTWRDSRKLVLAASQGKPGSADIQKLKLLRAFDHLSESARHQATTKGYKWSCEVALNEAKRGFVGEMGKLAAPERWKHLVEKTIKIPFEHRHEPERPGSHDERGRGSAGVRQ